MSSLREELRKAFRATGIPTNGQAEELADLALVVFSSDEVIEDMAKVVAIRAGEEFDSIGEFAQQVLIDTQRAAVQGTRP